jgi:hypothetical protein
MIGVQLTIFVWVVPVHARHVMAGNLGVRIQHIGGLAKAAPCLDIHKDVVTCRQQ